MKEKLANWLKRECDKCGLEAEVYKDYSGRGMFGSKTTGLTFDCDLGELFACALDAAKYCGDGMPDIDGPFKFDDMGRGTIIY